MLAEDPIERARRITAKAREHRETRTLLRKRPPSGGLPRAAFAHWLEQFIEKNGDLATAADRLGMDESGISRHLRGQAADRLTPWMRLDAVDHVFTAAGEPHQLAILYPLDEPMHNRWCENCHDVVTTNDDLLCPWCEEETTP